MGSDHIIFERPTYQKIVTARAELSNSIDQANYGTRGIRKASTAGEMPMEQILKMLWDEIAKPVLDRLGFINKAPLAQLPHITWCLTGPLTSLPLHAAGDYGDSNSMLRDFAVSSYTPNLSSLLVAPTDITQFSGMASVGQISAPGLPILPGTKIELDGIQSLMNETIELVRMEGENATTSAVLSAMEQYSWVHLACHASQNVRRPTASAFHLHNGPLDLAAITRKELKNADLAFLSACQTATGDHQLPEEAIHLAAGMIMAGYRRVIATIWAINDSDAPLIAEKFYTYMLDEEQPNKNKAARALHYAVECLRTEVGVKDAARWAPYIHIGL